MYNVHEYNYISDKHKINNETNIIINVCVIYNHIVTRGEVRGHTDTREIHVLDFIMSGKPLQ